MKKTVDINIGGIKFSMEEDAYICLNTYLHRFESSITDKQEAQEVMEDIEMRVAELFQKELKYPNQIIGLKMVQDVIDCMGEPEIEEPLTSKTSSDNSTTSKKLYRNRENAQISGVCNGLSIYFDIDVTIVRILFLLAVFFYTGGFWLYIILWIAIPEAVTIAQKLEQKGIPVTDENIQKYTKEKKSSNN